MRRERRGWTERYERRQEEEEEEERQKDGNEGRKRKRQHRRKIQGRKEGLDTIRSWFSADVRSSRLADSNTGPVLCAHAGAPHLSRNVTDPAVM